MDCHSNRAVSYQRSSNVSRQIGGAILRAFIGLHATIFAEGHRAVNLPKGTQGQFMFSIQHGRVGAINHARRVLQWRWPFCWKGKR